MDLPWNTRKQRRIKNYNSIFKLASGLFTKPKLMNPTPSSPSGDQQSVASRNFPLAVISGFAILGILVTGIWEFAGFIPNERLHYLTGAGRHGGNHKLLILVTLLFDGKMLTLLAMLFGAGIVLF